MQQVMTLEGKIVLITGGSQGIGRAIASAMAQAGGRVVIAARSLPPLEKAADELQALGAEALPIQCDVTSQKEIDAMASEVHQRLGPVEVLVNNAGIAESHKFIDHPDELWERTLDINLTGIYRVSKAFVPDMTAAKVGARYVAAYTASKHGVLGLTRALAIEVIPHNITVNAICPGYVDTPMTQAAILNIAEKTGRSEAEVLKYLEETNPQRRLIKPEEVALVATMLASELAGGMTGQAINIDGGAVVY